jgi:hypothetical protein
MKRRNGHRRMTRLHHDLPRITLWLVVVSVVAFAIA